MTTQKIHVCSIADLQPGETRRAGDNPAIAVFNFGGVLYALADLCTHGQASMSEGYIEDDCTVECPVHSARFCLKTGKALTQPANIDLEIFEVIVESDEIFVLAPQEVVR
jgi:3-phenylpropionate/trans-cinnamate dioxygenase ferredoxin subunit